MDALTDVLVVRRRLPIQSLPAFVVDSTIIRNPISADSLFARVRTMVAR